MKMTNFPSKSCRENHENYLEGGWVSVAVGGCEGEGELRSPSPHPPTPTP
jgi:hypothetical protein